MRIIAGIPAASGSDASQFVFEYIQWSSGKVMLRSLSHSTCLVPRFGIVRKDGIFHAVDLVDVAALARTDLVPIDGDELTLDTALSLVDLASDIGSSHTLHFEHSKPKDFCMLSLLQYGGVGDKYCSVASDGLSATASSGSNERAEIQLPLLRKYSFSLEMPSNPGATGHFFYMRRGTEYSSVPDDLRKLQAGTYTVDISGCEPGRDPQAAIALVGGQTARITAPAGSGPAFFGVGLYHHGTVKLVNVAAGASGCGWIA
jgi:hypothetical protein